MCPIIWVASVTFIRASIVFLYIRIFPTRIFRIVCYLVLAVNLCFFVGTILADCLICQPISYRWDRTVGGTGSCGDQKSLDLFIGIFNLFLDVTAVVLPMPILWGLKMAVGKKVMLSGMFGMGTAYVLPIRQPVSSTTDMKRFGTVLISMMLQHLRHYSLPNLRHKYYCSLQRTRSLRCHRHAHLPRSPPRRHQRLPPRTQTHLQQDARHCTQKRRPLRRQRNPQIGHDTYLHTRKPDVDSHISEGKNFVE